MRAVAISLLTVLFSLLFSPSTVFAASSQAYQDYTYQFDQYRSALSAFQVSYDQYQQFNSLTAQQDALDKAKRVLAQRDMVARTYFLFLNEKLSENPGLVTSEITQYRSTLTNQIGFLDQHAATAQSLESLSDAGKSAAAFTKNYASMQLSYRTIIVGLSYGYLLYFSEQFDAAAAKAQTVIAAHRQSLSPAKQAVLDRWLVTITNKRSVLGEQLTAIPILAKKMNGDVAEQDRQFAAIQTKITQAKDQLQAAVSNLKEIETALSYE